MAATVHRLPRGRLSLEDVLSRLEGVHREGRGWKALCPAHGDRNPSLSVLEGDDGGAVLTCFSGCARKDVYAALKGRGASPPRSSDEAARAIQGKDRSSKDEKRREFGVTLGELCAAKSLDKDFVANVLGWKTEIYTDGLPCVRIPYPGLRHRNRLALFGKQEKCKWGGKPSGPIGCHQPGGKSPRELGSTHLFIVEGETDLAALCQHGLSVLGVPGATLTKYIEARHLDGAERVYFVREPDGGGDSFAAAVPRRLKELGFAGRVKELALNGAKDPAELHAQNPAGFREAMIAAAKAGKEIDMSTVSALDTSRSGQMTADWFRGLMLTKKDGPKKASPTYCMCSPCTPRGRACSLMTRSPAP